MNDDEELDLELPESDDEYPAVLDVSDGGSIKKFIIRPEFH